MSDKGQAGAEVKVGDVIDGRVVTFVLGPDDFLHNQVTMNRDGSVTVAGLYVTATSAAQPPSTPP